MDSNGKFSVPMNATFAANSGECILLIERIALNESTTALTPDVASFSIFLSFSTFLKEKGTDIWFVKKIIYQEEDQWILLMGGWIY